MGMATRRLVSTRARLRRVLEVLRDDGAHPFSEHLAAVNAGQVVECFCVADGMLREQDFGHCDVCSEPAIRLERAAGVAYRACELHERYLRGWIREAEREGAADSEASRRTELAMHGRRGE